MAAVDLLDFVRECKRLVKQALERLARWVRVVIHCYRIEDEHSYRKTENRLEYLTEIREVLDLDRGDVPEYTTIYKSFDRLKMWVWRALLR